MAHDLLAIGRTGVDVYPLDHGVGLDEVRTFEKFLGGSATNVAVAAARHGRSAALVTRVGRDPFGRYVRAEAARLGVDPAYITPIAAPDGPPTPVTFCEVFPPDDFPLYFYRHGGAPDLMIEPGELPLDEIRAAGVHWSTVTGLSAEPSRAAHFAGWRARGRRPYTVLDLDYRPMFWAGPQEAAEQVGRALEHVTVAVGNREECEVAVGERDPHRAADALLDRGLDLAVVKQGPKGVLAATREERVEVAPFPVRVVNGLGAGDAFGGALVHGLLSGWDLRRVIGFANVAGALVAGRLECSTAMPTTAEVEEAAEAGPSVHGEPGGGEPGGGEPGRGGSRRDGSGRGGPGARAETPRADISRAETRHARTPGAESARGPGGPPTRPAGAPAAAEGSA